MARTSLRDISALPDPLQQYNFDLIIPNLPFGGNAKALTIKCLSTPLPTSNVEDVTVSLHGVDFKFAGRQMWNHTLATQYLETRDMSTYNTLNAWVYGQRNSVQNTGAYASEYKTTGWIHLYDDKGLVVKKMQLMGLFCQTVDEPNFDGSASGAINIGCTFAYDYILDDVTGS